MAYDWINDVADAASSAFDYIGDNEWAANAIAGAASAGLSYYQAEQEDKRRREAEDRAWDRKMSLAQAPEVDQSKYDWSNLASGELTDGGLLKQAQGG